jgi:carbon-monoxide dehydrogenase medium subunit
VYAFEYVRPVTLTGALAALRAAPDGRYMAGGMTLLPTLKQRLAQPSHLIDLAGVPELTAIRFEPGLVTIGAMATHDSVARSDIVRQEIPALAALAGGIGDPQVRNRGTIGGSLANNDPAADYPAAILALAAIIRTDRREIAADDFFRGMFETALEADELITAVRVPVPQKAAYAKFDQPASRYAMAGVFVAKTAAGVRVAVTGAAPAVFRQKEMEARLNARFAADAIDGVAVDADGLISDLHGSAEYRAHLAGVMAKRAVTAAA